MAPAGIEGIATVEMEADPAESGANGAGTVRGNLERVSTAEIDGDGGGRIHNELAGGSPDGGVNGADIELKAFVVRAGFARDERENWDRSEFRRDRFRRGKRAKKESVVRVWPT